MSNAVMLILVCGGFLLVLALIGFAGKSYNLDGIKSQTVGDGQHGTARFATPQEIHETYHSVRFRPSQWRQGKNLPDQEGFVLGSETHGKQTYALVDSDDVHCMMIGAAGIGKTANCLFANLEYACACGMSFLCTDTKGDLARNYGSVAKMYGYNIAVIDLRNPTRSDRINILDMVNKYIDLWKANKDRLDYKAKAEKYAKIIAKTIVMAGADAGSFGQNTYFYDGAEGLIASTILLLCELCPPETRHIVSVYKLIQDLSGPAGAPGQKSPFQTLLNMLPEEHKARWFAGTAASAGDQAAASVVSTAMSRLNTFLDSEMEQILCFDTKIDVEEFCKGHSAVFIILPEEDNSKYFMVSLIVQQMYREILAVADEYGGKLPKRAMFYLDEIGTIPKIESLEMAFSAIRSRRVSIMAIIQSFAQLERNYGKEGSEIIMDNCQDTIFGGFSPISSSAEKLSQAMGEKTVMTGSISRGKNDPSRSLQMMGRRLMTPDELRGLPKGQFIVMKTGKHPMRTTLKLFLDWGITFDEEYTVPLQPYRQPQYANAHILQMAIREEYPRENEMDLRSRSRSTYTGGPQSVMAQQRASKQFAAVMLPDMQEEGEPDSNL